MPAISISPGELIRFATEIERMEGELKLLYDNNLYQQIVNTDLKEAYRGTAAEKLSVEFESYRAAYAALSQQIKDFAGHLRAIAEAYDVIDNK